MIESCQVSQDPAAGAKSDVLLSPIMRVIRGQPDNPHLGLPGPVYGGGSDTAFSSLGSTLPSTAILPVIIKMIIITY